MSAYSVDIVRNSGFNPVNIPDGPTLLMETTVFDIISLPAVDLLQDGFLSSVRVATTWDVVKSADYCKIGTFYYFVTGVKMLSADCAELSLVLDYITTAGGVAALKILDGLASRISVPLPGSDYMKDFAKYCIEDPYLAPSEPLQLEVAHITYATTQYPLDDQYTLVESTLDLGLMGSVAGATEYMTTTGVATTQPRAYTKNGKSTHYIMDNQEQRIDLGTVVYPLSPDDDVRSSRIARGIANLRALGIENAIVRQVAIPKIFVSVDFEDESVEKTASTPPTVYYIVWNNSQAGVAEDLGSVDLIDDNSATDPDTYKWKYAKTITARWLEAPIGTNDSRFAFWYTLQDGSGSYYPENPRALYGSANRFGILTTSGDRLEANPEDLVEKSGGTYLANGLTIRSTCDPHLNGRPYHRFKTMNGENTKRGFWQNAVPGLPWKDAPILYTEKKGSILDRQDFEITRKKAFTEYDFALKNNLWGGLSSSLAATEKGRSAIGSMINALGSNELEKQYYEKTYEQAKEFETKQFITSQEVVEPTISIDYNAEAFRDFYGETVICYRYHPSLTDLKRMDKILNMYGNAVSMPFTASDLSTRKNFNYIEGSITVGSDIPRWLADGCSMMISNGVRIWHVKPNPVYYNKNGNPNA